jgi:hypothetical protein
MYVQRLVSIEPQFFAACQLIVERDWRCDDR